MLSYELCTIKRKQLKHPPAEVLYIKYIFCNLDYYNNKNWKIYELRTKIQ